MGSFVTGQFNDSKPFAEHLPARGEEIDMDAVFTTQAQWSDYLENHLIEEDAPSEPGYELSNSATFREIRLSKRGWLGCVCHEGDPMTKT